jgi:hypothetical protein
MAKIKVAHKASAHPIEIEASGDPAARILNRCRLFMQNAGQASCKYTLEAAMAGFLSVSVENALSVTLQTGS